MWILAQSNVFTGVYNIKTHKKHDYTFQLLFISVMVSAPEAASQSVGRPCGLGLEIPGLKLPEDFDLLTAVLKRPGSTTEEPLKLVLNSDNTLSVSFIPKETGEHLISVFKNKRHVTGSPFSVMVSGPGPADASKVKAYGPG